MTSMFRARLRQEFPFFLCALVAVCGLILGGGTRPGFLGDAVLQLLAIPLFLISMVSCLKDWSQPDTRVDLCLCACIVIVPIIQTLPIPPELWTHFPSRDAVTETYRLIGQDPGWLPLSLTPQATAASALSLLPPIALFLGARQLDVDRRRRLVAIVLVMASVSVILGLGQLAGGPQSPLRFYQETNPDEAVGFFANRNHFSVLLYVSLVLASSWAIDSWLTIANAKKRSRFEAAQILIFAAGLTLMFVLGIAQIMTRSRTGIALTLVAVLGIAALMLADRRNTSLTRKGGLIFLLIAVGVVALFTAQFGLTRLVDRFSTASMNDGRLIFAEGTLRAARSYFPFGSGIGSFPGIYPMFEKPDQLMADTYVNRTHNDFLEAWMEGGLLAMFALAIAFMWVLWRSIKVWTQADPQNQPIDTLQQRAASIALGLIALHSLVDYPLRTSAIMCLMALSCALLTKPPLQFNVRRTSSGRGRRRRHREEVQVATGALETQRHDL